MFRTTAHIKHTALGLAMLTLGTGAAMAGSADAVMKFDVAENPTKFVFDKSGPVHDDGMPDYGNAFITRGYIYPHETLKGDADGVTAEGEPEFPDKVLGTWTCYGYFVGDGVRTDSGTWIVSKQIYEIEDADGKDILISEGPELVDKNTPFVRVVSGGTGHYAAFDGAIEQTALGFHDHGGVKFRFELVDGESS